MISNVICGSRYDRLIPIFWYRSLDTVLALESGVLPYVDFEVPLALLWVRRPYGIKVIKLKQSR